MPSLHGVIGGVDRFSEDVASLAVLREVRPCDGLVAWLAVDVC